MDRTTPTDELALVQAVLRGYPDSMARADALRACRVLERALAAPDTVPAVWDGKLPEQLQRALNALRLECPPAVVADVEHQVRSHYEALHTSLATTRRMFSVARDRLEAIDAQQPDPFATRQPIAPSAAPVQAPLSESQIGTVAADWWTRDPVGFTRAIERAHGIGSTTTPEKPQ